MHDNNLERTSLLRRNYVTDAENGTLSNDMACSGPQETTSGRYCRERVEQYFSRYTERIRSQISTNSASSGYGK